jgi:hypothetical protein
VLAGVVKRHIRDRSRQLASHIRHEDLATRRLGTDARGRVHRFTRELALLRRNLARVQTDTNTQRRTDALQVEGIERTLNTDRARHSPPSRDENGEEAIAECSFLIPALVLHDLIPDELVVVSEQRVGLSVTECRPERGRTLDIREHDGDRTFGEIGHIHCRHPMTSRYQAGG